MGLAYGLLSEVDISMLGLCKAATWQGLHASLRRLACAADLVWAVRVALEPGPIPWLAAVTVVKLPAVLQSQQFVRNMAQDVGLHFDV